MIENCADLSAQIRFENCNAEPMYDVFLLFNYNFPGSRCLLLLLRAVRQQERAHTSDRVCLSRSIQSDTVRGNIMNLLVVPKHAARD